MIISQWKGGRKCYVPDRFARSLEMPSQIRAITPEIKSTTSKSAVIPPEEIGASLQIRLALEWRTEDHGARSSRSPGVALFLKFLGLRKQSIFPSAAKETA